MTVGVVAADPEALRAVRRVGTDASWDLTRTGRRLALALAAAGGAEVPAWARSLGDEICALAEAWEALDSWVGRVGDAVAGADVVGLAPAAGPGRTVAAGSVAAFVDSTPTWVDGLSDEEAEAAVLAAARQLRPFAPFLMGPQRTAIREQLAALVRRVRRRWPEAVMRDPSRDARCAPRRVMPKGLDEALDLLALPGEGRRLRTTGIFEAALTGFAAGAATKGYETPGAEAARTTGQVLSGVLVFGDARDGIVEATRGNWWGVAASAAGAIPGAGDAFKGVKAAGELADTAGDLRDAERLARLANLDNHLAWGEGGHAATKHVGLPVEALFGRLAAEPIIPAASTLWQHRSTDVVAAAITSNRSSIDEWVAAGGPQLKIVEPYDDAIGTIVRRGGTATTGSRLRVIIRRSDLAPEGWYIHTIVVEP